MLLEPKQSTKIECCGAKFFSIDMTWDLGALDLVLSLCKKRPMKNFQVQLIWLVVKGAGYW